MTKILLSKEILEGLPAISCVENYILGYLKANNVDFELLFYKSYVDFYDIVYSFCIKNTKYIDDVLVERVQDIAKSLELIDISWKNKLDLCDICENFEWLIGVKPDAFEDLYGKKAWREDHYAYIKRLDSNNYYYLNDNPRDQKTITYDQLRNLHNGEGIRFSLLKSNLNRDELFEKSIALLTSYETPKDNIAEIDSIVDIRDAVGILRMTRTRMARFYSKFYEEDFFGQHLFKINTLYAKLEYMRIRNKFDSKQAKAEIEQLYQEELMVVEKIRKGVKR